MNENQFQKIKRRPGFIAALDQSGGSTPGALKAYGIKENAWSNEEEMFGLVHQMRARIITSPSFNGDRILGAILFHDGQKTSRGSPRKIISGTSNASCRSSKDKDEFYADCIKHSNLLRSLSVGRLNAGRNQRKAAAEPWNGRELFACSGRRLVAQQSEVDFNAELDRRFKVFIRRSTPEEAAPLRNDVGRWTFGLRSDALLYRSRWVSSAAGSSSRRCGKVHRPKQDPGNS
jgi:hypothetical protein